MVLGMIPMSLGVGEGGEQNAPLARAVIGGLLFATLATLIFVPAMYRLLRGRKAVPASVVHEVEWVLAEAGAGRRGVRPHNAPEPKDGKLAAPRPAEKEPQ